MIYHLTRPAQGGMLRVLNRVLEAYVSEGLPQELWTNRKNKDLLEKARKLGIKGRHWPLTDKLSLLDPIAFLNQTRLKDGLVFYHGFKSFIVANPGKNPAILCLYNSLFPPHGTQSLRQMAFNLAKSRVKNLLGVIVASNSQAQDAKLIFQNVRVIPSGVDTSLFAPSNQSKIIGFLGRLRKEKGVDLLLDAAKHFEDWKFEFAGPDLNGYSKRKVPSNVTLLGEVKNPEKVISKWSIMVLPSYTEAMPLSILEGMSSGLCIIATDTGDIKTMLGDAGIIVPVGDGKKLVDALKIATSDENLRREYGLKARHKALEYDWSNVIKMWLSLTGDWRQSL
ncbi:MAG: glycosyltransferase family 4 protein [Firmicutes bacterium]|nr:glycosyltransferase family 4 protein [Bacillota bacterium]MDD4693058.1 glycosyltransferase family 4 protein [Bacillota bacterium]